jgi:hypothetical protein
MVLGGERGESRRLFSRHIERESMSGLEQADRLLMALSGH